LHLPVLYAETLEYLITDHQGSYVDCTLGGGGHFRGIIQRTGSEALLIGIDQDPAAIQRVQEQLGEELRARFIKGNFRDLESILIRNEIAGVNGILIDLGVSSFHLDEEERGFSYHKEALLDMRMDPENGNSAWEIVNKWSVKDLQRIIHTYGEERFAGKIARGIAKARSDAPIQTTLDLVEIIRQSVPAAYRRETHPARRTFQALRIEVNQELEALKEVLPQAVRLLKPGGRLCVISFHSLEDRIVKEFFIHEAKECLCPAKQPICTCDHVAGLKILTKKPVVPSPEEVADNSRARSAKLRVAEKKMC